MKTLRLAAVSLIGVLSFAAGCGSETIDGGSVSTEPSVPGNNAKFAIRSRIRLALDADGTHASFPTQNGSRVAVPRGELVGKTVFWVFTPGGEPVGNAKPLEVGMSTIASDLSSEYVTPANYGSGPWEVGVIIAVSGKVPVAAPTAGDLAAFDNTPPPSDEPPPTGVSVRVRIKQADAAVELTNRHFIRFGK
ncbi:MAG TPA: hypothetical protein VGF45_11060 [Polyangia bacterium]